MKQIAIVCAAGIGDALLMQIAAHALQQLGHATVTFSHHLPQMAPWFPGFRFETPRAHYDAFDAVVLQYDNTVQAQKIRAEHPHVHCFYGDYQRHKHGPLRAGLDFAFSPNECMAQNIAHAMAHLFSTPLSLENGLTPPKHLVFQKFPKRVLLHHTSTSEAKNWRKESFCQLRDRLANDGWDPLFIDPFPTLSDLAAFIYESGALIGNDSGPGHLASNLGLQTVIIGPSRRHLTYWRPGWTKGEIAHPARFFNKFKLTRTRWKLFVSVNKVFKLFNKIKSEL